MITQKPVDNKKRLCCTPHISAESSRIGSREKKKHYGTIVLLVQASVPKDCNQRLQHNKRKQKICYSIQLLQHTKKKQEEPALQTLSNLMKAYGRAAVSTWQLQPENLRPGVERNKGGKAFVLPSAPATLTGMIFMSPQRGES